MRPPDGRRSPIPFLSPPEGDFAAPDAALLRSGSDLARFLEHTLLRPDAGPDDIRKLAKEASTHGMAGACVNSVHVELLSECLAGTPVLPVAVVGFPLGASLSLAKAYEARLAVDAGAREVDMVVDIGAIKGRDYARAIDDVREVVEASRPHPVKVILETGQLTAEEKVSACVVCRLGGAAYVKTSTGFQSGGATVEDVALLRRAVGSDMGVKASGGIRTAEQAYLMVKAGANRLGTSASLAILKGGWSFRE
jgi:deoxyribose-phosphate aldolase